MSSRFTKYFALAVASMLTIGSASAQQAQQYYTYGSGSTGQQQPAYGAGYGAAPPTAPAVPRQQLALAQPFAAAHPLAHRTCSIGFPDNNAGGGVSVTAPPLLVGSYTGKPYRQPLIIDVQPGGQISFTRTPNPENGIGGHETVAVISDGQGAYKSVQELEKGATITSISQWGHALRVCYKTGTSRGRLSGSADWVILNPR